MRHVLLEVRGFADTINIGVVTPQMVVALPVERPRRDNPTP